MDEDLLERTEDAPRGLGTHQVRAEEDVGFLHCERVEDVARGRHARADGVPLRTDGAAHPIGSLDEEERDVDRFEVERREHIIFGVLDVEREEVDARFRARLRASYTRAEGTP